MFFNTSSVKTVSSPIHGYPSAGYLLSSLMQLTLDALAEVRIAQQGERGLQLDGHRLGSL